MSENMVYMDDPNVEMILIHDALSADDKDFIYKASLHAEHMQYLKSKRQESENVEKS